MRPYEPPGGYPENLDIPTPYVSSLEAILAGLRAEEQSRMLAVAITQLETGLLWLKAAEADERHKKLLPHKETGPAPVKYPVP